MATMTELRVRCVTAERYLEYSKHVLEVCAVCGGRRGYFWLLSAFLHSTEEIKEVFIINMVISLMLELIAHVLTSSGIMRLLRGNNMLSNLKCALEKSNELLYAFCWSST